MVTFTPYPIEVVTDLGNAYLIYVESGYQHNNDIWTCVLCESGEVKHFQTKQVRLTKNHTFQIYERKENKEAKKDGNNVLPEQSY